MKKVIYNSPIGLSKKKETPIFHSGEKIPEMELVEKVNDTFSRIRVVGTETEGTLVRNIYIKILD